MILDIQYGRLIVRKYIIHINYCSCTALSFGAHAGLRINESRSILFLGAATRPSSRSRVSWLHHARNITNGIGEEDTSSLTYVTDALADANNGDDDWRPGDPATPRSVVQFAASFVQLSAIRHYRALAQDSYATSLSANHRSSSTTEPSASS